MALAKRTYSQLPVVGLRKLGLSHQSIATQIQEKPGQGAANPRPGSRTRIGHYSPSDFPHQAAHLQIYSGRADTPLARPIFNVSLDAIWFVGYSGCKRKITMFISATEYAIPVNEIPLQRQEEPDVKVERRIRDVLLSGHPVTIAFSSGKDSSVLASIALITARKLVEAGHKLPPLFVVNSDTGVEQPEISQLARIELTKIAAYAKKHSIDLQVLRGKPALSDLWGPKILGGRALPAFPDSQADCSTSWKVDVNTRLIKAAMRLKENQGWNKPVVMTGVRSNESIHRNQNIAKRQEVAEGLWQNELGQLRASPLLDITEEDVWYHLGACSSGLIDSYSDFADTIRIYRDSSGGCVIVADIKGPTQTKPCGTRHGCWTCTRVSSDKSMIQMIKSDPNRYGYLTPLSRLRDFISNTQYDWNRRQYVGRTIDDEGYIAIQADVYSPAMLAELLRYTLSAQAISGVPILDTVQLIAIDARWSMYGLFPPFPALKIYFEVMNGRIEMAPIVERAPKTPVPRLGKLFVGTDWVETTGHDATTGLRNVGMELHFESCGVESKRLKNGAIVSDFEGGRSMTIDPEGAELFMEFEAERHIAQHCRDDHHDWTHGYRTYLQFGTIDIGKGRSRVNDEIIRRTQWRQARGLHGQVSQAKLLKLLNT